jgi:tRNA modification GTPase
MHRTYFTDEDTIAAIATPPGEGGIAIIRISGKGAFKVLDKIFKKADNGAVSNMESHRFYRGHIYDPNSEKILDSVLCVLMKSPHSYTGENVVEIHSHGGYLVPKKILDVIFRNDVRPAKAGEFTLRAFLNGKMDLSQAEAVADVVIAQTDESLKQAELQLEGFLSSTVNKFKEVVLDILAEIEAQVDFPEDEIEPMIRDLIVHRLKDLTINMEQLLATYEEGRIIKHGVYTAILGKPNVGKSSLLNKLVMKDRAIVSHFPGTTRDFIEETLDVKGIPLKLVDTAGIRAATDEIELIGVRLARKKAEEAELIIAVLDGSTDLDQNDIDVLEMVKDRKTVLVINKIDLPQKLSVEPLISHVPRESIVSTSAKLGSGIEELQNAIESLLLGCRTRMEGSELIITELRHKLAIEKANEHLLDFLKAIAINESPEFLVVNLKAALDSLSEITGEITNEEVLDRIFSKFCIGK